MKRVLSGLLAALALSTTASAQDDPTELSTRSNAAAAEGRDAEAVSLAEQAWRLAEAQWGDGRETGVLAINAARLLIAHGRESDALEPASRALQLAEADLLQGVITPVEAAFFVGVAEVAAGDRREGVRRLRRALDRHELRPSAYDDIIALAWIRVIEDAKAQSRWLEVLQSSGEARVFATTLGDDYAEYVYQAAMLEAEAALARRAIYQAHVAFGWAAFAYQIAYPDRANAATNVDFARLLASQASTSAILMTTGGRAQSRTGTHITRGDDPPRMVEPGTREELAPPVEDPVCMEWSGDREAPRFPPAEAQRGQYGAVLMAYDLTRDGAVENIRTVVTSPERMSPGFVQSVRESMATWRAVPFPDATDDCLRDRTTIFQFAFQ